MDETVVFKALYDRYITPTKAKRDRYLGIEIEMPIVNYNGTPVDFSVVHKLTEAFAARFHMHPDGTDDEGHIYSLKDNRTGDIFSYDCSYNNLELSLGKGKDINQLYKRFKLYCFFIQNFLALYRHTLTGMGINPNRKINRHVPILNERYRMLFHHLTSYENYTHPEGFHSYPDFGMFCSASQVQIDVEHSKLVDTINLFSMLEPVKALLFSNSVMPEEEGGLLCVRDMLWENSMQGYNPKNIGMFEETLKTESDLLHYIAGTSIYCTMRNGRYVNFKPVPVLQYFKNPSLTGEFWNGTEYEAVTIEPDLSDLEHLRTFKFEDLTYRGTIEFRSCCCQPLSESMTVAAFHAGLFEMTSELNHLLSRSRWLFQKDITPSRLRKTFCSCIIPPHISRLELKELLLRILHLAKEGLKRRGYREEWFLEPLYERAKQLTNPAKQYICGLHNDIPVNELVRRYAVID
ncbi:MAG: hypothetical protein BGN88_13010 [Clostridiales bacterium 43-6]|mgnify:CR=1 FL=1|nr:MAG: hypothetical protein BGN88_13010 [Clostridiales bacterium 43-6]